MDQTQGTQGPWEWWSPPVACAAPCRSLHCNWTRRKFARCNRHARSRPHISHPPRKPRPGRPGLLRYFNQLCCFMLLITIYIYINIYTQWMLWGNVYWTLANFDCYTSMHASFFHLFISDDCLTILCLILCSTLYTYILWGFPSKMYRKMDGLYIMQKSYSNGWFGGIPIN